MSEQSPLAKGKPYPPNLPICYSDMLEVSPKFMRSLTRHPQADILSQQSLQSDLITNISGDESNDELKRGSSCSSSDRNTFIDLREYKNDERNLVSRKDEPPINSSKHEMDSRPSKVNRTVKSIKYHHEARTVEFGKREGRGAGDVNVYGHCYRCKSPIYEAPLQRSEPYYSKKRNNVIVKTNEDGYIEVRLVLRYQMFVFLSLLTLGSIAVFITVGWPGCLLGCNKKIARHLSSLKHSSFFGFFVPFMR